MDNLVTISNKKDNVLEFDVDVQGIDTNDMTVRFIIEASGMELGFDSKKQSERKWSVEIPALSMLDTTAYPFHIDIIVDGYYFEPLRGSVNVVGTHEVYASKPENVTLSPGKPKLDDIIKSSKVSKEPLKDEEVKTQEIPVVKPNRKFIMQPLKVKDGKELFKTLTDIPKPERKTDDKLDDEILGIFKKAKEEKKVKPTEPKKEETKTVAEKPTIVAPKATDENSVESKEDEKKIETKETKKVKETAKSDKESKKDTENKKEEKPESETKKKVAMESIDKKPDENSDAKSVAEKILHAVTGLGGKKESTVVEKSNDDKIKDIIKEKVAPSKKHEPYKKAELKEAGAIKKITKDKKFVEVDESKEQNIKNVLKESNSANEEKRTVTTKPFKKKDVTIH